MTRRDDETLQRLSAALAPGAVPPAAGRARIRAMVETGARAPAPGRGRPRRLMLVVAAVCAVVLAFGAGTVFEDHLPGPVRTAARAIGLPVDSSEFREGQRLVLRLSALVGSTEVGEDTVVTSATLDEIQEIDTRMVSLVKSLDPEEQAELLPVAHEVHLRAVQVLAESGRPQGSPSPAPASPPPPSPAPSSSPTSSTVTPPPPTP